MICHRHREAGAMCTAVLLAVALLVFWSPTAFAVSLLYDESVSGDLPAGPLLSATGADTWIVRGFGGTGDAFGITTFDPDSFTFEVPAGFALDETSSLTFSNFTGIGTAFNINIVFAGTSFSASPTDGVPVLNGGFPPVSSPIPGPVVLGFDLAPVQVTSAFGVDYNWEFQLVVTVPEPATYSLSLLGLVGMGIHVRRRRALT